MQALVAELLERAAVNDALEGRLFPNQIPRGTAYPCLAYRRKGNKQRRPLKEGSKQFRTRIVVEVYAQGPGSYEDAYDIMEAVRATLTNNDKGARDVIWGAGSDEGGVHVVGCMVDDDGENGGEVDDFIPAEGGDDKGIDVISLLFWVEWDAAA